MYKGEYSEYLKSQHWLDTSFLKKLHAEFRCEDCGIKDVPLEVHHLHYYSLWCEKMSDLVCCCRGCHQARHDDINRKMRDRYQPMKTDDEIKRWASGK